MYQKRTYGKSKAERQEWWNNLPFAEREEYIRKIQNIKWAHRNIISRLLMDSYGNKYQCKECHHHKVGCCEDVLPNGCEYWFSATSKLIGLAYQFETRREWHNFKNQQLRKLQPSPAQ